MEILQLYHSLTSLYDNISVGPQYELMQRDPSLRSHYQLMQQVCFWAWKGHQLPCWSCQIFSMHSTNVQIMNWKHDGWIWLGLSCVGSVPGKFKSPVIHLTTSNWSGWKIIMHQVRLWVSWWIYLHQVRVWGSQRIILLLIRRWGQLEDLAVPGQAVG